jgi:hypothetical protein
LIRRTTVLTAVAAAAGLAGCTNVPDPLGAPPADLTIHIVNRSNTALALGPGFTVPACGTVSATLEVYEAEQAQLGQMMMDGTWTAPPGAVQWDSPVFAGHGEATEVTMVVSSVAPLAMHQGVVAEADLPACRGAPVGVTSEVVPDEPRPAVAPSP